MPGNEMMLPCDMPKAAVLLFFLLILLGSAPPLSAQRPQINDGGVVNGASFAAAPSPVSPGSIISVFGVNLAPSAAVAQSLPLPTALNGATLLINGLRAPLFFVSSTQINAQVPWEVIGAELEVQATVGAASSGVARVNLSREQPGLFILRQLGPAQAAVIDIRGNVVDAARPAQIGDIISIYCTGLGPVAGGPASGWAAPTDRLVRTILTPRVTIGGIAGQVLFSGLAPGFVGLYQINVTIPSNIAAGAGVPIRINAGNSFSNLAVIAVGQAAPATPVTQVIAPSGGTVTVTDSRSTLAGVAVDIPNGALSQSVRIEIRQATPPVSDLDVVPPIELGPTGTEFRTPATLRIPYSDNDLDGLVDHALHTGLDPDFLHIRYFDPAENVWIDVPSVADRERRTISAQITHFSVYRVFYGRWPSNSTLTYAFGRLPANRAAGVTDADVMNSVRRALSSWEPELAAAGIRLQEVRADQSPRLLFRWADSIVFSTLKSVNRDAFARTSSDFPFGIKAQVIFYDSLRFDDNTPSTWTHDGTRTSGTVNIEAVALHEIGHALGLSHPCSCSQLDPGTRNSPAVMNGEASASRPVTRLLAKDLQDFRDAYGLFYAGSGEGFLSGSSRLFLVNPIREGRDTEIGQIRTADGRLEITDIALLPRNKLLNGQCCTMFGVSTDQLYIIDIRTGLSSPIGNGIGFTGVNSLVFDSDDTLYAGTVDGEFLRIDLFTGRGTRIGNFGGEFISSGDLAFFGFFGFRRLYATARHPSSADDILVTVDTSRGSVTRVGFGGPLGFSQVFGLSQASAPSFGPAAPLPIGLLTKTMFGLTAGDELIQIDPRTGIGTYVRDLTFPAFGATAGKRLRY